MPVHDVHDEVKRRNREALQVNPANRTLLLMMLQLEAMVEYTILGDDPASLANWPDPDGYIRNLGEIVYMGEVRVTEPNIFDAQENRIHPSKYGRYLVPGTRVAALLDYKM